MTRQWVAGAIAGAIVAAAACGGSETLDPIPGPQPQDTNPSGNGTDGGDGPPDSGTPPDGGSQTGTDGGTGADGGTGPDGGTPDAGPGPWPLDPMMNYSAAFNIGPVQSVGVDDAYNIWLLNGARIGVLRPGTTEPVWVSNIGQARNGFGAGGFADYSTVICGGAANQAYVGYYASGAGGKREDVDDPGFQRGDMDVVQLNDDGTISLTEHLHQSAGSSQPWPPLNIGIRNTNDWHYDEDLSVLVCKKVMKGPFRGEIYIGTNHGVTRIRGLVYNSHRHPIWMDGQTHMIGFNYGLGIAQNGDVLMANEWNVGIITPSADLTAWDKESEEPWQLNTFNQELNSLAEFDYWRGFEQTTDGRYYLASERYGLWEMERTPWATANWFKVSGAPTETYNAIQATDDGSLFLGTQGSGLWRMTPEKTFEKVDGVQGSTVRELVYDPTVSPSMLYVLTNAGLFVLRGY